MIAISGLSLFGLYNHYSNGRVNGVKVVQRVTILRSRPELGGTVVLLFVVGTGRWWRR